MNRFVLIFGLACCLSAQTSVPKDLHASAANSREVTLEWTAATGAAEYLVERKPLGGQYAPLMKDPVKEPQSIDGTIAAMTTYVYRVKALNAAKVASAPSNEITVGPPPVGFSQMAAPPPALKEGEDKKRFARYPQMVLDANGDPAAAYYFNILKGDDQSDSGVYFVSWNRARYRWNPPVEVMKVGVIGRPTPFSLARDTATNVYGVASETTDNHAILLAVSSDNGAAWKTGKAVSFGEDTSATCPSLALANGKAHLAFAQSNSPYQYATGAEGDDPASWPKSNVPYAVEGTTVPFTLSMATDSAGNPGLAYVIAPNQAYNVTVAFWRPGGNAVKVTDSRGFQMDDPYVKLDFAGTKPRIGIYLGRTESRYQNNEYNYLAVSSDNGANWPEPVYLPNDAGASMGMPAPAFGPKGEAAVMMDRTGGTGSDKCDQPKLARSADLVHWSTCSPNNTRKPRLSIPASGQIRFAGNGKLYAVISNPEQDTRNDGPLPEGVVLWREP